jgi:hypothetical protein
MRVLVAEQYIVMLIIVNESMMPIKDPCDIEKIAKFKVSSIAIQGTYTIQNRNKISLQFKYTMI